jgi:choline-sulfatase
LLKGASEKADTTAWGEYLAEGAIAPLYMLRRGTLKFIHTPADPDQLFDLATDPLECANLAATPEHRALAQSLRREVEQAFDIARITQAVLESQQARIMMFEALRRGAHFPWDFQPLRDASEQYTRNHMSVTDRDLKSRFPPAPDMADRKR